MMIYHHYHYQYHYYYYYHHNVHSGKAKHIATSHMLGIFTIVLNYLIVLDDCKFP